MAKKRKTHHKLGAKNRHHSKRLATKKRMISKNNKRAR